MSRSILRRFWPVHLKPGVARISRRMVVVRLFCYVLDGAASVQGISFCCDVVVVPCPATSSLLDLSPTPPPVQGARRVVLLLVGLAITRRPSKRRRSQIICLCAYARVKKGKSNQGLANQGANVVT
jgi:hypothetical protein